MGTFHFTFFFGTLREVWSSGHWSQLYSGKVLLSLMLFVFSLFIPRLMKHFKREERRFLLNHQTREERGELDRPIDVALVLALADLKAKFLDMEKDGVSYYKIRGSEEFEKYKTLTGKLRFLDLTTLASREQKLAFWINLYNTGVIHGIIELGLRESVKEIHGFFERITYDIGGFLFTLNDMEHGILRGNRRHPAFYQGFEIFSCLFPRRARVQLWGINTNKPKRKIKSTEISPKSDSITIMHSDDNGSKVTLDLLMRAANPISAI